MGTGELVEEAIERSHIAGNLLKKTMSPGATALTAEQLESVLEDLTASRAGEQDVKGFLGAHPPAALPGTLDALAAVYNAYVDWRAGSGGGGGGGGASADPLAALQAAMEADDADALEEAIDAGADANAKLGDAPAITVAAEHGCLDLIQVLLEKGASVDAARPDGSTALILAAANSHQEVVENLVQRGASVGATRADGASALTLATHDEIKALLHEASDEHGLDEQLAMPAAAAPKPKKGPGRRSSVSAESVDPTKTQTQAKKVIEKAEEDKERIRATLRKCFLFKNSDAMQITDLVNAMYEVRKPKDADIIVEGDREANEFFIVDSGEVDVYKGKNDDGTDRKLITLPVGAVFGELALMYNTPRAATIRAASDEVVLWAMDRDSFKQIVLVQTMQKRLRYEAFLEKVELLKALSNYERATIADSFEEVHFASGTTIIEEGAVGDNMYFLVSGKAKALKAGAQVETYEEGQYFGELALLNDETRRASVVAETDVELVSIDRPAFERLMGPVVQVLRRQASSYAKYVSSELE